MEDINNINTETLEGKLLLAAIGDIMEYETNKTPNHILKQINKRKNRMGFEKQLG